MHAYYACMHTMYACILCMCMHAWYACMHEGGARSKTCLCGEGLRPRPRVFPPPHLHALHAYSARILCMHTPHAGCIFPMKFIGFYACMHSMHSMHACILCMHMMHACMHNAVQRQRSAHANAVQRQRNSTPTQFNANFIIKNNK